MARRCSWRQSWPCSRRTCACARAEGSMRRRSGRRPARHRRGPQGAQTRDAPLGSWHERSFEALTARAAACCTLRWPRPALRGTPCTRPRTLHIGQVKACQRFRARKETGANRQSKRIAGDLGTACANGDWHSKPDWAGANVISCQHLLSDCGHRRQWQRTQE